MALVIAALVSGIARLPVVALTLVVCGGALLLLEQVKVRVDEHGLQATSRWGWPRVGFPLEEIDAATAIDVRKVPTGRGLS